MAHNPHTIPAPDGSGLDAPLPVPAGDLLIDGEWTPAASGERREQLDPSNGRPLASIAIGGPADIDQAIASSAAAFPAWSNWPARAGATCCSSWRASSMCTRSNSPCCARSRPAPR